MDQEIEEKRFVLVSFKKGFTVMESTFISESYLSHEDNLAEKVKP